MKRHLTVLASSAMLAAFAGMAMAADAPVVAPAEAVVAVTPAVVVAPAPVVVAPAPAVVAPAAVVDPLVGDPRNKDKGTTAKLYFSGTLDKWITYDALQKKWTDGVTQSLSYDQAATLNVTVPLNATKLNAGFELQGGTTNWYSTLEGPALGGTYKVGRVAVNWDNWIANGTDGAGAAYNKAFGPLSVEAYTSNTGKATYTVPKTSFTTTYSWKESTNAPVGTPSYVDSETSKTYYWLPTVTQDVETKNHQVTGAKANVDLGNGNNLSTMAVLDETKTGAALVTGTYKAGMATFNGRYAASFNTGIAAGNAVNGKVELKPFDGLTLSAEGWQVDKNYVNTYAERDPGSRTDNCYGEVYFWQKDWTADQNGIALPTGVTYNYTDKLNYKLRADFAIVKDVASVYGEYFKFANDLTTYGKIGGSNKDIWLSDAFVQFNQDSTNVYNAKFEKDLGGIHYTLEGGMKAVSSGLDYKKAYIKAEKQFDFIKLYGLLGSDGLTQDYKLTPKVGAYIYVAF